MAKGNIHDLTKEYYAVKFQVANTSVTAIYQRGEQKPVTYCRDDDYARRMVTALNKGNLKKLDM